MTGPVVAVYRTGHFGAALLAFAPAGHLLATAGRPGLAHLGVACVVALARLPDLDRRAPLAHRGPTHAPAFLLVVAGLLGWSGWTVGARLVSGQGPLLAAFGATVGATAVGSHLLADAVTPAGVPALWPVTSRRFGVALVRADSPAANLALLVLGTLATVRLVAGV